MDVFWKILYLGTAVNMVLITALFYRAKNGILRRSILAFFASVTWGIIIRIVLIEVPSLVSDSVLFFAALPMYLASAYLAHYLYKTYKR